MDRQDDQDEKQREMEHRQQRLEMYADRMGLEEHAEFVGVRAAQRMYRIKHGLSEEDLNDGTWQQKEEKRKSGKRKHSTLNSRSSACQQHSTSKGRKANVQKPNAKDQSQKEGTKIRRPKCAKRAVKAGKSRLIVPNRGEEKFEDRNSKAEGDEQRRPNAGLAKETKGLQTEKFADRKMGEDDWQGYEEEVNLSRPCKTGATNDVTGVGNEPGRETGAPTAVNPGESSVSKANQRERTDWDESNQIYWTKEELEGLAELRRQKQNGGNTGESNLAKATGTDVTELTDTADGEAGVELKVQSPESKIQGQEADMQGSSSEVPSQPESGPKLTARERAYIAWFEMNQGKRPVDEEELTRLYAEMRKEDEAWIREALKA